VRRGWRGQDHWGLRDQHFGLAGDESEEQAMYDAHDATEVKRDKRTVVVHYDGMTESVTVKGGRVVRHTAGAELHCLHAIGEAARALEAMSGVEVD
jgi:hypothetical protein